jgi:hypothetical protein
MNSDEFSKLLQRFARKPTPSTEGRHVYLWQNTLEVLLAKMPRDFAVVLNLHELCRTLDRTPSTTQAARQVLNDAIAAWVNKEFPRDDRQRALAVVGCDLLARYQIPLGQFMSIASESRLVVFVVPKADSAYRPNKPLPAFVYLRAEATLAYLKPPISDNLIVGE